MFEDFDLISEYSRAQAIRDGVLVDVTNATDRNARRLSPFKFPVAMTATAFGRTVEAGGRWEKDAASGVAVLVLPGCQDF
ncbi:MAG TPA: DUF6573 family protein, partial [Gemmataceae bacterium]|nr:DUF6573 family protein [Gemmataceae bacterium]